MRHKKKTFLGKLIAGILWVGVFSTASNASLIVLNSDRGVEARGLAEFWEDCSPLPGDPLQPCFIMEMRGNEVVSTNPSGPFNASVNGWAGEQAVQDSAISSLELSGSLLADTTSVDSIANSWFEVEFQVDEATPFSLSSVYDPNYPEGSFERGAFVSFSFLPFCTSTFDVCNTSGVLQPGTYVFRASLVGSGSHNYSNAATLDFSLVLVPEPSTALLMGLGLLGLVATSRCS